jgi:hypothetical protein
MPPGGAAPQRTPPDSVGWLALAVALTIVNPARFGHITAIAFTALLTAVAGLSRIDVRARRACDVLAGEALAVMRSTHQIHSPPAHPPRPREALSLLEDW